MKLPLSHFTLLTIALTLLLGAAGAAHAADELISGDTPAAFGVAGTLLPVDEVPYERRPGAAIVAWGGEAYLRLGDYYWAEDGTCWKALKVTTTAYVPVAEQCNADSDHTATMTKAKETYGIAADPRALPYGTVMRIPGYGEFKTDDTGRAMRDSWNEGVVHLDLRIPMQRYDGVWRDSDTCNRIARRHGRQPDRIVLVQVAQPTFASVE